MPHVARQFIKCQLIPPRQTHLPSPPLPSFTHHAPFQLNLSPLVTETSSLKLRPMLGPVLGPVRRHRAARRRGRDVERPHRAEPERAPEQGDLDEHAGGGCSMGRWHSWRRCGRGRSPRASLTYSWRRSCSTRRCLRRSRPTSVRPDRRCPPRHRTHVNSTNQRPERVSMTWARVAQGRHC